MSIVYKTFCVCLFILSSMVFPMDEKKDIFMGIPKKSTQFYQSWDKEGNVKSSPNVIDNSTLQLILGTSDKNQSVNKKLDISVVSINKAGSVIKNKNSYLTWNKEGVFERHPVVIQKNILKEILGINQDNQTASMLNRNGSTLSFVSTDISDNEKDAKKILLKLDAKEQLILSEYSEKMLKTGVLIGTITTYRKLGWSDEKISQEIQVSISEITEIMK